MKIKPQHIFYNILIIVLITLAGCKVSQQAATVKKETPKAYRDTKTEDTTTIANISWRDFLANDELATLIDTALKKNNDFQISLKNIEAAEMLYRQSKLAYLPMLNLSGGASTLRPAANTLSGITADKFLGTNHIDDYSLALNLSWEIDFWGKLKNQKKKALAQYMQTYEAKKAIQTSLVSRVANGYYNLIMLDAQLLIARKNLLLADSTLNILNLQYKSGYVTLLGVQQVESQKLLTQQLIPGIEMEIALQENALSVLIGILPGEIKRSKSLNDISLPEKLQEGVPSSMLRLRPDVRSAELDLLSENASVGIARANMLPAFTISARGGFNSLYSANFFAIPASIFGTVIGGLVQPLFQLKQLQLQYEVSKIRSSQAALKFRQSILVSVEEVSNALIRVKYLKEQQQLSDTRVKILEQSVSNANITFANGIANYLEVMTAESNLLAGALQQTNIKRAQLDASIELYRSLGGGWK